MCRTHGKSGRHGLSLPSPARLHSIFSGNFPVTVSGKNDQRPRGEKQREGVRGMEGESGKWQGQRGVWKIDFSSKLTGLQNDKHCALLRSIQRHAKLPSRRRTGYCIFAHTLAHTGTHTQAHTGTHIALIHRHNLSMKNVTLKQSAASSGSSICGTFEQFGTQCHTATRVCGMRQAQACSQLCGLPCCQSFYTFWLHCAHIFTCKTKLQSSACQRANPAPRCEPPLPLCPPIWAAKCPVLCAACRSRWLA